MKREAIISSNRLYRFDLTRTIEPGCDCARCKRANPTRAGYVLWVLNNPSTADAHVDDPTERRGWGYTSAWGYREMHFANVNPFRCTDPSKALRPDDAALAANDLHLLNLSKNAAMIVCAWGTKADKGLVQRALSVLIVGAGPHGVLSALTVTKHNIPKHPLYLNKNLFPRPWVGKLI